jgi:hypothetical protein
MVKNVTCLLHFTVVEKGSFNVVTRSFNFFLINGLLIVLNITGQRLDLHSFSDIWEQPYQIKIPLMKKLRVDWS